MECRIIASADTGFPAVQCDQEASLLQDFFETEIQQSLALAEHLLNQCKTAGISSSDFSGNLFNILINKDKFVIENTYNDMERLEGERSFLERLLVNWVERYHININL